MSDITSKDFIEYFNCPCTYFPEADSDAAIMKAYNEACERGKKEGFVPVIVAVDDTLYDCLTYVSETGNTADEIAQYRKNVLAAQLEDGSKTVAQYVEVMREDADIDGFDWDEIMGDMDDIGEAIEEMEDDGRFTAVWGYDQSTIPVVLAEIPVKNPWEVFAYVPFGGWNECPGTLELMSVTKYWYEKYGAIPAVITHDVLEMKVEKVVSEEEAKNLALEQYGFCPDIVDQGCETIGALAAILSKSKTWFFWWD